MKETQIFDTTNDEDVLLDVSPSKKQKRCDNNDNNQPRQVRGRDTMTITPLPTTIAPGNTFLSLRSSPGLGNLPTVATASFTPFAVPSAAGTTIPAVACHRRSSHQISCGNSRHRHRDCHYYDSRHRRRDL
eukprot:scaffold4311_cov177-Amphora_coffeaeformis.AAC.5